MQIKSIGIDLAKPPFTLLPWGTVPGGNRKKFSRSQLLIFTSNLSASLIGIEAGVGRIFWGEHYEQAHEVRLIPARFVRPFVKSNKNDYRDAEAIAEALERENMRFVPIKRPDTFSQTALVNTDSSCNPAADHTCYANN